MRSVDHAAPGEKTLRVLALTRYARQGASSRLRTFQFLPFLETEGFSFDVKPLFGGDYLETLYGQGERSGAQVGRAYLRRMRTLCSLRRYDLLWIEKELFPYLPAWAEKAVGALGVPYVVDYDDAIFHRYDLSNQPLVRHLLGRKIDAVMRGASMVFAGNPYLAERAGTAGARRVELLPTVVDLNRYSRPDRLAVRPEGSNLTIGWIGSPTTAKYLQGIAGALRDLQKRHNVRVLLIGAGDVALNGVATEVRPWSEEREIADLHDMDIGVMPLVDTPWERGKCGYKLIQYMACGTPVVASPVGVNIDIVTPGLNGYLAETEADWVETLEALILDGGRRGEMGRAGRQLVEKGYSLQAVVPRLSQLLHAAASAPQCGDVSSVQQQS